MHTSKNKILAEVALLLICIISSTSAQEQLGLRVGNYSGINGTMLNPASAVSSPLRWDINVIAAGSFAENNYIFIKEANLFKVLRNGYYSRAGSASSNTETTVAPRGLEYDFTGGRRRKEAYTNTFVTFPSAMFHVKEHTFGIFFNMRSVVSTNRVPSSLNYLYLESLQQDDVLHVDPFKVAGMAWSEVGLNYGRNIFKNGKHSIDAGITFKFLQGYEAFYFKNHEPTDITFQQDSLTYQSAFVSFGLASGISGFGAGAAPYDFKARGYGASIDIGAVYYSKAKDKEKPYGWKAGISLVDFGKIAFKKNAQAHEVTTVQAFNFIQRHYTETDNFNEVFQLLSTQSMDDPNATLIDDKFGIWVPAGISIFGEYAFTKNIFVNAMMMRRMRFSGPVPERDNIWAVTPRYEHRWFEVSIPVVLYNDKDLRLGTALRLGPVVIGSDNITSWFGSHNFSGSDVYVALKLNPYSFGKNKSASLKKSPDSPQDCFEFKE